MPVCLHDLRQNIALYAGIRVSLVQVLTIDANLEKSLFYITDVNVPYLCVSWALFSNLYPVSF